LNPNIKEHKFNSKKEAQTFIDSEIPGKLNPFFRWDKFSRRIVKNNSKIKGYVSKLGYFIIMANGQNIDKQDILNSYRDKDRAFESFLNRSSKKALNISKSIPLFNFYNGSPRALDLLKRMSCSPKP
jgi:hypothetical protein